MLCPQRGGGKKGACVHTEELDDAAEKGKGEMHGTESQHGEEEEKQKDGEEVEERERRQIAWEGDGA